MDSLENLAMYYLVFAEEFEKLYSVLIMYGSALFFGLVKSVTFRMQRSTYILNLGLIVFAVSVTQLLWLLLIPAISGNFLSVLVLIDIIVLILAGYAYVVIAKARSNDAYGHTRYAWLAFVPFAALWLWFKPSKGIFIAKMPKIFTGVTAVILGIVLSITGRGIGFGLEHFFNDYVASNTSNEEANKVYNRYVSHYILKGDFEEAMIFTRNWEPIGAQIDEITILQYVDVSNMTMVYGYRVTDEKLTGMTQEHKIKLTGIICDTYTKLLDADVTIVWQYFSKSKPDIARVVGNSEVCGF